MSGPVRLGPQLCRADKPRPQVAMGWRDLGACKGTDTDRWVPDTAEQVTDWHRSYCDQCPVRAACVRWATDCHEHGVWAATTRDERTAMRKRERNRQYMAAKRAS